MKDTFYFKHDCNARQDEKILALRMRHKWEGYGLYWAIIERLRESSNYECVKDYNLIAFDLRTDAATIKSIIEDFGLFTFTEDGKRFYSERLSTDMSIKNDLSASRSAAGRKGMSNRYQKSNTVITELQHSYNTDITIRKEENIGEDIDSSLRSEDLDKGGKNALRFVPPTTEQVQDYVQEKGFSSFDTERFIDFYTSKGWMVGKNKMKDWRAAVRNWHKSDISTPKPSVKQTTSNSINDEWAV